MILIALASTVGAQTYQVNPGGSKQSPTQPAGSPEKTQAAAPSLGWGSNIENARLARAAQMALERQDYGRAVDYAQRAAQAASSDPQLWFLLGYAARLDKKYQLAVDAYSRGLRLDPSSLDAQSGLAQTYSLTGRTAEAEDILKRVLASNPERKGDALLLGDLYMKSGDYTSALDWLSRAERIQPDARSELLLALSYQHLKQLDRANHYLEMAKRRAPNDPDVQRSLAGYYREVGKYPEAIAALRSIANPKPDVTAELAYTYQLDGKMEQAAGLYAQAANALPKQLDLQLSAAQAEVAAGAINRAEPFLRRAAALDPEAYRLHAIRGDIARVQERDEDAVREYVRALARVPANPAEGPLYRIQLHMDLVELYRDLNDESASRQQLGQAQTEIAALDERGSDRAPFLRLRALVEMNAGEFDKGLADIEQALAITPHDPNTMQLDGDMLVKLGRTADAIAVYKKILAIDPDSRFALTSIGYAERAAGNDRQAESYFERLAQAHPSLYVPYLALGDMYTAQRQFTKAEAAYRKAYARAPQNVAIVAGGMDAAIEAHDIPLAGVWLRRVTAKMDLAPKVLREKERYYSFKDDPKLSAEIGRKAIEVLPQDRDVVVYLGYDMLRLGEYKDLGELTAKYEQILPREPDIPLLAGYVAKHDGQMEEALADFTEALKRDPTVVTAYVNRGYVLSDLHQPRAAAADFQIALKREPKNGVAHLGLAFADLNLNEPSGALHQAQLAQEELGDSEPIHLIRATAYGREDMLAKAAHEYRAALKFNPNDGALYLGLGNTLFADHKYREAIVELNKASRLEPKNAAAYAMLARCYAGLQDREQTLRNVRLAEEYAVRQPEAGSGEGSQANDLADIYVSTGEALIALGDRDAAMMRFSKALLLPGSDRVSVRLAIAQLMAQQGHSAGAERQIALAQMEAEAKATEPVTGAQYVEAADVLQQLHEYDLSQSYLQRAKAAGAPDIDVRVASANNYLALGDAERAAAELAAVKSVDGSGSNYPYLLAEAQVYEQQHHTTQALSAFAQAANAAGEDQTAEEGLLQTAGNEGLRITPRVSLLSDFSVQPIFEDSTVYVLDSMLDSPVAVPKTELSELPTPRSSIQTEWTAAYHLHFGALPAAGGFFQIRNARGTISVPATSSIVNRNTTDYTMNFGVNPTVHMGTNALTFNTGVQGTIRRDSLSPIQMNQNLFRVFTFMTTSTFFNAVSADGYFIREVGPFTESNIDLRALAGALNFRVGSPWGKTALLTGWGVNDQQFTSVDTENYFTSSYIGLAHRFSDRFNVQLVAEDIRSWRVVGPRSGIAQALRPAGTIDFTPARHWDLQATAAYSSTRAFHAYDMIQSGFSVSYIRPLSRTFNDETGQVHLKYPIRFAAGMQEETFPNFTQGPNQQLRPYVSITLF